MTPPGLGRFLSLEVFSQKAEARQPKLIEAAMTEDELEQLRGLDWDEIAAKVANYARSEARNRYGWNGVVMAKGTSPEDLACDAIAEFWQNPSRLPGDCVLTTFLCGLVRHKLWNMSQWEETRTTRREEDLESVAGFTTVVSPDAAAETKDDFMAAITMLSEHTELKGKPDHELILTALSCGVFGYGELAKETGLPINRIYQVQRELNAMYPDIKRKLHTMKGANHDSKQ